MTWKPDSPYIPAVELSRPRLLRYCPGMGLDLGCGPSKIKPTAIGVDLQEVEGVNLCLDIEQGLPMFADGSMDFVFASHFLEHVRVAISALSEWWRVLRPGGNLVLVLPHANLYPRIGQPGGNPDHKFDYYPDDILRMMDQFAAYEVLHNETRDQGDEFSFEIVLRKVGWLPLPGLAVEGDAITGGRRESGNPRALVIRYGGLGDHVMASPIFRKLKEAGYHVTYNTNRVGEEMMRYNPHIDEFLVQAKTDIPNPCLERYWKGLSERFDRVINLSESIEGACLAIKGHNKEYEWSDQQRREKYGSINYYDHTMVWAGFPEARGERGELHFSRQEELAAHLFRKNLRGRFVVLWVLAGSSLHKTYPWYAVAMDAFAKKYPKTLFITVGGYAQRLLELANEGQNYLPKASVWGIRQTMIMTKYADLVIGGQTGVMAMAGCFDTPKICFLTHSGRENLCRYWKGDYSIQSKAPCSPCHKKIDSRDECPQNEQFRVNVCAAEFEPEDIIIRMQEVYRTWHKENTIRIVPPTKGLIIAPEHRIGNG